MPNPNPIPTSKPSTHRRDARDAAYGHDLTGRAISSRLTGRLRAATHAKLFKRRTLEQARARDADRRWRQQWGRHLSWWCHPQAGS